MGAFPAIRCLHLADLHLGWEPSGLGGKEAERARERDSLLRRAVDFALDRQNGIGLVVIAGDLFDTHKPGAAQVEEALKQLGRLAAAGVALVTTPGNHDEISYTESVYRTLEARWPKILVSTAMPEKVATLKVTGAGTGAAGAGGVPVHVYSLAYTGGVTRTKPPIREFPHTGEPGIHLAVLHGSLGWDGGDRSLPLEREALAGAGYDYVALGHFHRFSEERLGRSTVVYAGLVDGRGFSDPGTGEFVVAEIAPGHIKVERTAAGVRRHHTFTVDVTSLPDAAALDQAVERLAEQAGPQALVQVTLEGTAAFGIDLEALAARHRDRFYHLEVVGETSVLAEGEIEQWATEPTLRGEFIRRLQGRLEAAAAAGDEREALAVRRALVYGLAALKGGAR